MKQRVRRHRKDLELEEKARAVGRQYTLTRQMEKVADRLRGGKETIYISTQDELLKRFGIPRFRVTELNGSQPWLEGM